MRALALALGLAIGASLGALGGGGSVLTVPALVYALGESPTPATTASLVIVGITAVAGTGGHARAGRVRWCTGTVFGLTGIAASFAGTWANRAVDPHVLLLAFAALMLLAGAGMLRQSATARTAAARTAVEPEQPAMGAPSLRGPSGRGAAVKVVLAGLAVGFLTGFFGVGGGFVIVPALIVVLRYPMPDAVGTSLFVIAVNSGGALAARAGHETFHWEVIVPFTIAAIVGSLAGNRIADRVAAPVLTRAFVVLLLGVAAYVATLSLLALDWL